jgi:hypothetical protein
MKSFTALKSLFTTLSLNSSTQNNTLGGILINDIHRQLLLKYFDNERQFTMTSIGPMTLTLAASPNVGDKTATLSTAWSTNYITCQQLVVFSDGEQRNVTFTQGSTAITWQGALNGKQFLTTNVIASGATSATLQSPWLTATQSSNASFSDGSSQTVTFTQNSTAITWVTPLVEGVQGFVNVVPTGTSISCTGVQSYPLPANVSKLKNTTITIGQLVYTPAPVLSITDWTKLNALPYNSSIPAYFYVYNNQLNFWPIPAASGEVMTLYCQINIADMTYEDYTTPGTVASSGMVVGSNAVTGSGTTWNSTGTFPTGVDLTFANIFFTAIPPQGDGLPYQVQSFTSNTALTLFKPVVNVPQSTGGGSVLIGQYPLLGSDFHDALVYGALRIYFCSIVSDPQKFQLYDNLFKERLNLMEFYLGTKTVTVDLGKQVVPRNPNLFYQGLQP